MKNIPEKIYLIIGDECPSDANFKDLREVTWSSNSNFKNDIEYVLATEDKKAPVEQEYKSAIEILANICEETVSRIDDSEPVWIHQGHILKAMQEYASQERNRAISECIDIVNRNHF